MSRILTYCLGLGLVINFLGCAGSRASLEPSKQTAEDKMVFSSQSQAPSWLYSEPDMQGGTLFFVGMSGKFATEQLCRDDAMNNAISKVAAYLGTLVKDKIQKMVTSYGLSSEIVDPTTASRRFQEIISSGFVTSAKAKEWYVERWQNKLNETYYLVRVLSKVDKSAVDDSFKQAMNGSIDDLKKKRDAANEEKAKSQYENAMKMFEDAKNQGFSTGKE